MAGTAATVHDHSEVSVLEARAGRPHHDGRHPLRLGWLTNFAAPYRRPVWRELSKTFDLRVLLINDASSAKGTDRSSWLGLDETDYELRPAGVRRTRVGHFSVPFGPDSVTRTVAESDVVLLGGWEEPFYWQALAAAKLRRTPVLGFYESTLESQHFSTGPVARARSLFFRRLDGVVTPGPSAARAIRAMGVPAARIHVGFNAVDVQTFHDVAQGAPARTRADLHPGHRYVYVGQLIERKNVAALLEAFAHVSMADDHLTIIGTGVLESDLRAATARLDLEEQVTYAGNVAYEDLPAALAGEHTLVLPSTEEVWGLVVNEALAAGLGVVVSDCCGVAESVHDMDGVFVCGTDAAALADALEDARRTWNGWIREPEILQMTPERFAHVFRDSILGAVRP